MNKPDLIDLGDKVFLKDSGFEYIVTWTSDKSILIKRQSAEHFIPKSMIKIYRSLKSATGYTLFKIDHLPEWFVKKNRII